MKITVFRFGDLYLGVADILIIRVFMMRRKITPKAFSCPAEARERVSGSTTYPRVHVGKNTTYDYAVNYVYPHGSITVGEAFNTLKIIQVKKPSSLMGFFDSKNYATNYFYDWTYNILTGMEKEREM